MDYWQFLLTDVSEFTLVTAACEQLLIACRDQIYEHVETIVVKKFSTLQQAQVCTDIDYFVRSIPFYKRILIRRATVGTGKLTVGGFAKWFKLDVDT